MHGTARGGSNHWGHFAKRAQRPQRPAHGGRHGGRAPRWPSASHSSPGAGSRRARVCCSSERSPTDSAAVRGRAGASEDSRRSERRGGRHGVHQTQGVQVACKYVQPARAAARGSGGGGQASVRLVCGGAPRRCGLRGRGSKHRAWAASALGERGRGATGRRGRARRSGRARTCGAACVPPVGLRGGPPFCTIAAHEKLEPGRTRARSTTTRDGAAWTREHADGGARRVAQRTRAEAGAAARAPAPARGFCSAGWLPLPAVAEAASCCDARSRARGAGGVRCRVPAWPPRAAPPVGAHGRAGAAPSRRGRARAHLRSRGRGRCAAVGGRPCSRRAGR